MIPRRGFPMSVASRKRITLEARLMSLSVEFKEWRDISEPRAKLEKHNSQIRRLTAQLAACRDRIAEEIGALDDAGVLGKAREMEDKVLEVHRLWGYFRARFESRLVPWHADYLCAGDELAWACYSPVQNRAVMHGFDLAAVKEPPLVYLTGGWSPLLLTRGEAFVVEREATLRLVTPPAFYQLTRRLPVPLIGVPWSQLSQAFDATMIGHEVGHAVEDDFGLTDDVKRALTGSVLDETRKAAWECWEREVFADWFGCLATGPAYVGTLLDLIAGDLAEILREKLPFNNKWGRYPTTLLRARLNLAFLDALDFKPEADALRESWPEPDAEHPMQQFEPDLGGIAGALLALKHDVLGGARLPEVLWFSRAHHETAVGLAKEFWRPFALNVESDPARVLLAAGRLAFHSDPAQFVDKSIQKKVVDAVCAHIPAGIRAATPDNPERNEADRARGASLFAGLGTTAVESDQ